METANSIISLLVTLVVLNLGDIFYYFFDSIGVSIRCRGVMATTTLLDLLAPKTSLLVVLVFLASLALVGGRLLVFATRCINGRNVSGHSLFGVFLLFFCRLVPLETL